MIRSVKLEGWKAFDYLEFEPSEGVTFVVARNGVGKSSLLQGIAWAVFGDRSGINAEVMRRAGHAHTSTSVVLDMPDGSALRIDREVGGQQVGRVDDRTVDLDSALRDIVGANLEFAARAVTLTHQTLIDHAASFEHLDAHLAEVFGIADLRSAATAMATEHKRLKSENQRLRAAAKPREANADELAARRETLAAHREELTAQRDHMRPALEAARDSVRQAREQRAARDATEQWDRRHRELELQTAALVGDSPDPLAALRAEASNLQRTISELTLTIGAAQAHSSMASEALALLEAPSAVCPTCQRPMSDHERSEAQQMHQTAIDDADRTAQRASARSVELSDRADSVSRLVQSFDRLGDPPSALADAMDVETAEATLASVETRVADLDRAIGEAGGAIAEINRTVETLNASIAEQAQRHAAIRREAVAQLTADTMRRTVDALMTDYVAPASAEIAARWKQVFGDRGTLQLSSKGVISMEREGHRIEFAQFSPGEQVVAMLALRFLTIGASTTSPFMLLDEPLECLDPANRRLVAGVLVGHQRPVEQIIVTTYEEPLARRIHATVPAVVVHKIG